MSNIIDTTGRTAATIAAEIRTLDSQGKRLCLMYVFEIGKRLVEAKEMVGHGGWGDYLRTQVDYSQDTANKYMRLYREYNENGQLANSDTIMNLDFSKAYKLLALPAEAREQFMQDNPVEDMTVKELEQAIRDRDAAIVEKENAQKAENQARNDVAAAQRKLDAAQRAADVAKSSEQALQKEVDQLNERLNKATAAADKAKQQLKTLKDNPKVPEDVMKKLRTEAEATASEAAKKAAEKELEQIRNQLDAATAAQLAAQHEAQIAEEKLEAMQKAAQLSDPNVASFNVMFKQIQEDFNKLNGYRMKAAGTDAAVGEKLLLATRNMLEAFGKAVN